MGAAVEQAKARVLNQAALAVGPRRAAFAAAVLAAAGYAYYANLQERKRKHKKHKRGSHGPHQGGQKKVGKKGKPQGYSLRRILEFLLPLVGRKIIALFALSIVRTALSNRLAKIQGYMFRAAFLRQVPLFLRNFSENVLLCLVAASVESTIRRVTNQTKLHWRKQLTSRINTRYFADMTYYKLSYVDRRVENPEQRICEDIPKLCDGLADLLRDWIASLVDAAVYGYLLKQYSHTHKYTMIIMAYILGAGTLVVTTSPNFGKLYKIQQEDEGSYRHLQARLRTNAESVAFYGGIAKEGAVIRGKFQELVHHQKRLLNSQWLFSMWQDFNTKYLAATMAVVLIIGPFFSGHLKPGEGTRGRAAMLTNMRYHTSVIISLFTALGTLAESSRRIMKLGAFSDRIAELEDVAKEIASGKVEKLAIAEGIVETADDEISFENAMVVTPADATLVKDLTVTVKAGTNLLVTGPNGSGKSSLFRVLGGLWPLTKGKVRKPGGATGGLAQEIFYVPQRPYVTLGTLQDQLIYPLTRKPGEADVIPESELRKLLAMVDLEYLVEREGGLDAVVDWGAQLSLGEQQRLGMARLFYHKPNFAILDECTSGVTVDMEERFCNRVKELGCTCVTISHRPALMAFHDLVLALDGEGGWSIHHGARVVGNLSTSSSVSSIQQESSAAGGKVRSADASSCFEGMQKGTSSGAAEADGAIIARAPPPAADETVCTVPPRVALQPVRVKVWTRWKQILTELLGRGRGAHRQLTAILAVVTLRSLLQDRMAALNGRTVEYVLRQDLPSFIRLIGLSVAQAAMSAILAPSLRMVADSLSLTWRAQLTAAANKRYLKGNTFYTVTALGGMTDVDQRLTRDVERLCEDLAALIPNLVKPVVDILWFSVQLAHLTGARGMFILYAYAAVGFVCLRAVTPNFGQLARKEYFLEGAFRNVHSRLRTHAESIAFFGGGEREATTIEKYFNELLEHLYRVIDIRWPYLVADDFFSKQLPHNVTWALTVLYALDKATAPDDIVSQGILVNDMRYLASVVTACFSSFGELLALHKRIAELNGGVIRVSEMLEVIEKASKLHAENALHKCLEQSRSAETAEENAIVFKEVDVVTPTGKMLARQLSFSLQQGHSILVTGPNGSGKSSLFRILGGLWPLESGQIMRPGVSDALDTRDIFYVPQKPYTTIGTLREQVLYPTNVHTAAAMCEGLTDSQRLANLDAKLDALMKVVRLGYLVEREGGWSATTEWGEVLSLGEQQRLGMARLFYHRPRFGVLDECTNATSVDVEERLYRHAAKLGITLATITQRAALLKYHDLELRLIDGEGDWQLRRIVHV